MKVSLVIVQYQGGRTLRRCIDESLRIRRISEILVVDNEGVGRELRNEYPGPNVRIFELSGNKGYGGGANVGLSQAREAGVLVANQDVVLSAEDLDEMIRVGNESGAWMVGPVLVDLKGGMSVPKASFSPPLKWVSPPRQGLGWQFVPWIPGAVILFTPGHTELRFDERLFMFAEDEELAWRVWRTGGRVAFAEKARVLHEGGTSTRSIWTQEGIERRILINRARFVFWQAGWRGLGAFVWTAFVTTIRVALRRRQSMT